MSEILFAIAWLGITTFAFVSFLLTFRNSTHMLSFFPLYIFFFLFFGVGLYVLCRGLKSVFKDKLTEEKGMFTYGRVVRIGRTGTIINGVPELKVQIATYVPYTRSVQLFTEVIGFAPSEYEVGDYLILQWYKDDVNIIQKTLPNNLPIDQREKIEDEFPINLPEQIIIDGNKYYKAPDESNSSTQSNFNSEW